MYGGTFCPGHDTATIMVPVVSVHVVFHPLSSKIVWR